MLRQRRCSTNNKPKQKKRTVHVVAAQHRRAGVEQLEHGRLGGEARRERKAAARHVVSLAQPRRLERGGGALKRVARGVVAARVLKAAVHARALLSCCMHAHSFSWFVGAQAACWRRRGVLRTAAAAPRATRRAPCIHVAKGPFTRLLSPI
jgi:hypothetical protein